MKKILFVALAAATMMSCTENEVVENAGNKAAIEFGTVVKNGTRALVTTTANFKTFTVNGYKTADVMGSTVQLANGFIDDLTLNSADGWIYTNTFYWPLTGNVQFFATSPKQALNITAAGYPTFDYTIKAEASQEDLVAANVMNATKATGKIQLPFQHLLTQVNFSIKGKTQGFTYTVTKLVIKGAKNTGTFAFDGSATVGGWTTLAATTADYTFTGSKVVAPVKDEATPSVKDFEEAGDALFMLMPQKDLSGVTLEITYTAAPTLKPTEYTFNSMKTLNLSGEWGMGKNIRYTLELSNDASPIEFDAPTVNVWTDEAGTNPTPTE